MDSGPLRLHPRGESGGIEAESPASRGVSGGDPSGVPCTSCTSLATGNKDGVLDDGADVNGKLDGTVCVVMVRFPLPAIWPRAPRPTKILRRL